ncbi:ABC transporter ATP-binding protein [Alphaproteobacteria bacterium]|nr:ABC transporter ATP-binding protein [Alphaproteobacteria bacterium]
MVIKNLLEIDNLNIRFLSDQETVNAVRDVSITLRSGEVLGIVGESGAGKSTIGNAIVNLLDAPGEIVKGKVIFEGQNLVGMDDKAMRTIRGKKIGMIFQDPQTSLNPIMTIGNQLIETIRFTKDIDDVSAYNEAIELLESVGIDNPKLRMKSYPHQFSGGMRQRVVIALSLAGNPDLIIADEPTTALDVSVQSQILELIKSLCKKRHLGVIIITHDIGVIANIADRVTVMFNGSIVETGIVRQVLLSPKHDYTKSLIAAVPRSDIKLKRFHSIDFIEGNTHRNKRINLDNHWLGEKLNQKKSAKAISVIELNKEFILKKSILFKNRIYLKAVNKVSFDINKGESFGIVGESGSGKSTIARLIAGLIKADTGSIKIFDQEVVNIKNRREVINSQRDVQMIFQDPYSSLNPRMRVQDIIAEPIKFYKTASDHNLTIEIVSDLLNHVGMSKADMLKYPNQFSGGQRQRISIARALASRPKILICDEPTSSLDVSVQAHILNLLKDLQDELGLTMLFISHDLPVIRQMCDRVAVMRKGKICEINTTENIFEKPKHSYTKELINLIPKIESKN